MPRQARITLADVPLHLIQRGNNRQRCFFVDADRRFYLECLGRAAAKHGCAIHAYVLMTNHVHLLLTPGSTRSAGEMMKHLGQRYVQYVNRTHGRSGTLWDGRFRSCIVQDEAYLLSCYRYIELNPVRAGVVDHPAKYRWSSYRANAEGEPNPLLEPHRIFLGLESQGETARANYRELFRLELGPRLLTDIGRATNGNFALGDAQFLARVEAAVGRRVTPRKVGRPRREKGPDIGARRGGSEA